MRKNSRSTRVGITLNEVSLDELINDSISNNRNDIFAFLLSDFLCEDCGKSFVTKRNFELHKMSHDGPQIQCPDCPKRFNNINSFASHKDVHRNNKYVCNICNAEFGTRKGLWKHLSKFSMMENEKRIEYQTNSNLIAGRHKAKEDGRRFPCTECSKSFYDNKDLKKHMETVHTTLRRK